MTGRFGTWESRTSPSAGGLHAIRLLVLPLEPGGACDLYDDLVHGLRAPGDLSRSLELNRRSVRELAGARSGTTMQLVADRSTYLSCYEEPWSLMWRDSGALCAILALVATSLGLESAILGRHGDEIARAAGLGRPWDGCGAVHVACAGGECT